MSPNTFPRALILAGGWAGHHPVRIADLISEKLASHGFQVRIETSLDMLANRETMSSFDLIVPNWTMGTLTNEQSQGLQNAVREGGSGLGGCHGGMGDAFRGNLNYEWAVGGHFVGHPHVGDYEVKRTALVDPITSILPESFTYQSEQYYMMVDPSIRILAETDYLYEGNSVKMPVVWTKTWGRGRVFYSALGHDPSEFEKYPLVLEMTVRGLLWAAKQAL